MYNKIMKLSCPVCLKTFEYFPPPNIRIILVKQSGWDDDKAKDLAKNLNVKVLYTHIKCQHCGKWIAIFYTLEENRLDNFSIDIDKFSKEV